MKTQLRILLSMLCFLCCSVTLASDEIYNEQKTNVTVTATHRKFTIQLKSNPTTGYSWFLREYNYHLIKPLNHYFQSPTTKLMGAPGFETWSFEVNKEAFVVPHQMVLRFVYARPSQGADNSTQVVFRVTTTPGK